MNKTKKDKIEKKNSPHFNVLDALIILLVILVIVGIYFRYNIIDFLNDSQNKEDYAISYTRSRGINPPHHSILLSPRARWLRRSILMMSQELTLRVVFCVKDIIARTADFCLTVTPI